MSDPASIVAEGLEWAVRPWAQADDALGHGTHERRLWPIFNGMFTYALRHERAFFDIGAHVGRYTLRAAAAGLNVLAVEPYPETFSTLRANVTKNGFASQVWLFDCAAWSELATLYWALSPIDERHASGRVSEALPEREAIQVDARPIDELMPLARIGCMKIDTEGSEHRVLRGATRILHRDRPLMLIEMHDRFCPDVDREGLLRLLDGVNYLWQQVLDLGPQDYIYCVPREEAEQLQAIERP